MASRSSQVLISKSAAACASVLGSTAFACTVSSSSDAHTASDSTNQRHPGLNTVSSRPTIAWSTGVAAASASDNAAGLTGPGAADILSPDVIAEHRTHQRFRTRRTAQARPPIVAPDAAKLSAVPPDPSAPAPPPFPDPPVSLAGASHEALLLGANTRCMLGWCRLAIARAYAFGLYADEGAIRTAVGKARSAVTKSEDSASSSTGQAKAPAPAEVGGPALTALLDLKESQAQGQLTSTGLNNRTEPLELSLVLVMHRAIPGDHLAHGFRNSALARLAARAKEREKQAQAEGKGQCTSTVAVYPSVDRSAALASGKSASGIPVSTPVPGVSTHAVTGGEQANGLALPSTVTGTVSTGAAASAPGSDLDAVAQLSSFVQAFAGWQFGPGEEIAMVWAKDGRLLTSFKGQLVPQATITHPGVIRAIFDVYMGSSPVSARAKATVEANIGALALHQQATGTAAAQGVSGAGAGQGKGAGAGLLKQDDVVRVVLAEHASRTK